MASVFCSEQLHFHRLGQPFGSFHAVFLGDAGGGEFFGAAVGAGFRVGVIACRFSVCGLHAFHADAHFVADADDALRLFVGVFVEFGIVLAADQDAHLVVVNLTELIEVQAGNDGVFFVQVALGVQVLAKAGADIALRLEPFNFLGLQLALAIDDAHIDLEPVLVFQQFLDAVVELEKGADQNQPVFGAFDEFFEEVIRRRGIEKLGHVYSVFLEKASPATESRNQSAACEGGCCFCRQMPVKYLLSACKCIYLQCVDGQIGHQGRCSKRWQL